LYALLPYAVTYQPYTAAHVLTQLQLLLFSGLAFFVMLPYLKRTLTITLDTDWLWRRLLPALAQPLKRAAGEASKAWGRAFDRSAQRALDTLERHTREDSALARTQATRNMALVVLLMLLAYLLLYLAG
jgi:multicomponent Na+:H+ antiporter subunit D